MDYYYYFFWKTPRLKKENNLFTVIIKIEISLLAPSSRQQLVLVLCFYRVIETRLLTNQRAYFLRAVF